ncbi:hypothetical protein [Novosphingobium olei]|uniref:Uncharacterized protein n=1 Tax=Novosphingobium olei TaxID=2728851 RepID=A0A7Y0GCS6_9SPHN|nr:hypothetical protein [Novosphingobium olei]NML96309.1 hypothetical protein [Novosphingobium olei]
MTGSYAWHMDAKRFLAPNVDIWIMLLCPCKSPANFIKFFDEVHNRQGTVEIIMGELFKFG